jgi:hypothetical protein
MKTRQKKTIPGSLSRRRFQTIRKMVHMPPVDCHAVKAVTVVLAYDRTGTVIIPGFQKGVQFRDKLVLQSVRGIVLTLQEIFHRFHFFRVLIDLH